MACWLGGDAVEPVRRWRGLNRRWDQTPPPELLLYQPAFQGSEPVRLCFVFSPLNGSLFMSHERVGEAFVFGCEVATEL